MASVFAGTVGTVMGLAAAGFETFKNVVKPPIDIVVGAIQKLIDMIQKIPTPCDVLGKVGDLGGGITSGLGKVNPFNARGTNYWGGGLTWVGEEGPELVNLPTGSQVFPHEKSVEMMTSESVVVNVTNVYARTPEEARLSAGDLGWMVAARARGLSMGRA